MLDFEHYWIQYCKKHTVLQAGRLRISGTNLQRIARDAHSAGHRKKKFEMFWEDLITQHPNVSGTTVLISTASIEVIAKKAYHPASEKWTAKVGNGLTSLLDDLIDASSSIVENLGKKTNLKK